MFFLTYLRRELRRRMRQAIVIALGLALGIGLVITVSAAAEGVSNAQSGVLKGLYGVGTDITVTAKPEQFNPGHGGTRIQIGPGGGRVCHGSVCKPGAQTVDNLTSPAYGPLAASTVDSVARLHDVASVAGGLTLNDTQIKIPGSIGSGGPGTLPQPKSFGVDGVDLSRPALGPLSAGKITEGRDLARSDAASDVAVVDTDYAAAHQLKVGSTITHRQEGVHGHRPRPPAAGRQPAGRLHPAGPGPGPGPGLRQQETWPARSTPSTSPPPARPTSPPCRRRSPGCCPRPPSPPRPAWPARSPAR